jgi:hypothetical protein
MWALVVDLVCLSPARSLVAGASSSAVSGSLVSHRVAGHAFDASATHSLVNSRLPGDSSVVLFPCALSMWLFVVVSPAGLAASASSTPLPAQVINLYGYLRFYIGPCSLLFMSYPLALSQCLLPRCR